MLNADLHSAGNFKLVGMDFRYQTELRRPLQDCSGLLHSKKSLVTKHINIVRKPLGSDSRNHLFTYKSHILVLPAHIFTPHGMCTEESGLDRQRRCLLYAPYHPQHLEFILSPESVSAFYLHRASAFGSNLIDAFH